MNPNPGPTRPPTDPPKSPSASDVRDPRVAAAVDRYWRKNVTLMISLLIAWAVLSLGCSILFADTLNQYRLFGTGFRLGFWFAQQGSILGFVLIILIYCVVLNRLDRKHHEELARLSGGDAR